MIDMPEYTVEVRFKNQKTGHVDFVGTVLPASYEIAKTLVPIYEPGNPYRYTYEMGLGTFTFKLEGTLLQGQGPASTMPESFGRPPTVTQKNIDADFSA